MMGMTLSPADRCCVEGPELLRLVTELPLSATSPTSSSLKMVELEHFIAGK